MTNKVVCHVELYVGVVCVNIQHRYFMWLWVHTQWNGCFESLVMVLAGSHPGAFLYDASNSKHFLSDETWVIESHTISKVWLDNFVKTPKLAFLSGLSTWIQSAINREKLLILSFTSRFEVDLLMAAVWFWIQNNVVITLKWMYSSILTLLL